MKNNNVPLNWKVCKLKNVGEFSKGKGISLKDVKITGLPALMYGDIYIKYDTKFNKTYYKIDEKTAQNSTKISKCTLLFTSSGETAIEIGKCVVYLGEEDIYIGGDIIALKPKEDYNSLYLSYVLNSFPLIKQKARLGQGHSVVHIYTEHLKNLNIIIPISKIEQNKIANILSTWDNAIELKEKLIEQKKKQKRGLMQLLLTGKKRLKGFSGEWRKERYDNCFTKLTTKKYQLKKTEYNDKGLIPVVDQGKEKIISFSNQLEKIFKCPENGIIVFGDHTREVKYIDFDFIVGADGTQILDAKDSFNIKFLYYQLQIKKIPNTGYNRHYKFIKEMYFYQPTVIEQTAIANVLSTADKEIELHEKQLGELKKQKKGLMQLLLTGIVRVN